MGGWRKKKKKIFGWTHFATYVILHVIYRGKERNPSAWKRLKNHPTMPRWFKGMMEIIICDWGLWPQKGLNVQCEGFKCVKGKSDCCCCWLLFIQPDFEIRNLAWKNSSHLGVTSVIFIPSISVSLQAQIYWAVLRSSKANLQDCQDQPEDEGHERNGKKNIKNSLDDVPIVQIQRWVSFPWTSHHGW